MVFSTSTSAPLCRIKVFNTVSTFIYLGSQVTSGGKGGKVKVKDVRGKIRMAISVFSFRKTVIHILNIIILKLQ